MSEVTSLITYAGWLTWILPIVGAVVTLLLAKVSATARNYGAVLFSFLAAVMALNLLPAALKGDPIFLSVSWIPALQIEASLVIDPLSAFMANVVAWISFLIMVYSLGYMKGDEGLTRYWFFMNYFIGNMLLLVLSNNLLLTFFAWEGVGLSSYMLISHWYHDPKDKWVGDMKRTALGVATAFSPSHAGSKAFVITRIGDIGFLIAILSIYHFTNTFNILGPNSLQSLQVEWMAGLATLGLLVPMLLLLLGGSIGKSAQFPLHEWLPDAMTGPTSVSALIHAATMVNAGVFFIARFSPMLFANIGTYENMLIFFQVVAWIGAITAFIAATQAMVAREVKKVLAYSTISQIGFMVMALGVGGIAMQYASGYFAGIYHLMSQAVFKASLFMAAGALLHAVASRYMWDMGGMRKEMKITFVAMVLASLSLAGIPPFLGFWSKDAILSVALTSGEFGIFALGFITVAITAFYSIRMIGLIFTGKKSENVMKIEKKDRNHFKIPKLMWVPALLLAVVSLVGGIIAPLGFEHRLEAFLVAPLETLASSSPITSQTIFFTAGISLVMVALGGLSAYSLYIRRNVDPQTITKGPLGTLHKFFYNRWYIDPLYYRTMVNGSMAFAGGAYKYFEMGIMDKVNTVIPLAGERLSRLTRNAQTGQLQEYATVLMIAAIVLAFIIMVI